VNDSLALTQENTPRIMARKYALVLRPEQHQPHWLVMKLRASDFRVAVTNRAREVVGAVDRMPWLSLLVADGPLDDVHYAEALKEVREKHPELPILWIRQDETATSAVPADAPTAFAGRKEVIEKAETLLSRRFYPAFMVDAVAESTLETLREGYRVEAEFISVSLKLTRNTLGEIIPVLPFSGSGVSGHLVLDAAEGQLRRIHERFLSKKEPSTPHSLGDLGGEILNQTLGRVKAKFGRFGVPIELGLPMVVMGKEVILRSRRAAPALIFDFAVFGDRHLFVEFSLTSLDLTGAHPPTETDNLVAGELSFL
jgi:CheY-specific phosphatase CheX